MDKTVRRKMNPLSQLGISTLRNGKAQQAKINKHIVELNTIYQQDIIDIYRLLHPTTAEYTFSSSFHGTFTNIDHILGHKTHLNIFKRIEITQCLLLDHNGNKLETNNRKISGKSQNTCRFNNILLNNIWMKEKYLKRNFKIF